MKKYLAILCAAMLCACCLALGACSGGGSSSAAASSASASGSAASASSAQASASASSASASASASAASGSFEGTWKLAAMQSEGITMAGDLSAISGESGMSITINADGTGTATMGGDPNTFTWTQKDAKTITMKPDSDSGLEQTADITLENGVLFVNLDTVAQGALIILSKDGTYADAKVISADNAKPITSADALVGTWNLSGINMAGMTAYGDANTLSQLAGASVDTSMTFNADGTVSLMGAPAKYTVSAEGAAIESEGISVPVKQLEGEICIDLSSFIGAPFIMVYSK